MTVEECTQLFLISPRLAVCALRGVKCPTSAATHVTARALPSLDVPAISGATLPSRPSRTSLLAVTLVITPGLEHLWGISFALRLSDQESDDSSQAVATP